MRDNVFKRNPFADAFVFLPKPAQKQKGQTMTILSSRRLQMTDILEIILNGPRLPSVPQGPHFPQSVFVRARRAVRTCGACDGVLD